MTTPPTIPAEATDAAETLAGYPMKRRRVEAMLTAALPYLLPGLFVALNGHGERVIWQRVGEGIAERSEPLLAWHDCPQLFDAIAALLPQED